MTKCCAARVQKLKKLTRMKANICIEVAKHSWPEVIDEPGMMSNITVGEFRCDIVALEIFLVASCSVATNELHRHPIGVEIAILKA